MGLLMQSAMNEVEVMSVRSRKKLKRGKKEMSWAKTLKGQIEILKKSGNQTFVD